LLHSYLHFPPPLDGYLESFMNSHWLKCFIPGSFKASCRLLDSSYAKYCFESLLNNCISCISAFQTPLTPCVQNDLFQQPPFIHLHLIRLSTSGVTKNANSLMTVLCAYLCTSRATQQCEPADNTRTNFVVLSLSMAITPELRCLTQQTTSEPWTVPLPLVGNDLDVQAA
jgi:hypothetical protein